MADYATVTSLNAATARISTIEANYVTTSTLTANYATIESLNAVNAKFNNLNANNITAGTLSVNRLDIKGIMDSFSAYNLLVARLQAAAVLTDGLYITGGYFIFNGHYWFPREIDGVTYLVQSSSWGGI